MSNKIKELIVVEGKSDICFLSSFLDADFYQVNGSAITKEDIEFLKIANKDRGIIIFTDPDFPGKKIRNEILEEIPNAKQAFVRKEVSIKHHKVGVAESTKEEVKNALENVVTFGENKAYNFTTSELYGLGLLGDANSSALRKKVCEELHIGFSNGKELLVKLNSINISLDELERLIKNVK